MPAIAARKPLHRFSFLGLFLVLSACGGGSGGGGSDGGGAGTSSGGSGSGGVVVQGGGFAPSTGPGDTQSYLPADAGDQWFFNDSTTDPRAVSPTGVVTLAVNGTMTVKGATATVFRRTDPTSSAGGYDQYFNIGPGGVTALGNTDATDSISPLIVPYVQLLFPVQIGPVSSLSGQNLPAGTDAGGNPTTLDLTQTIANADVEAVDVPAGSFTNALKQITTITGTFHDGSQSAPVSGSDTAWYVPGIGQVKDSSSATSGSTTITASSELRGYIVKGQKHGFMPASDLMASLIADGCTGNAVAPPAVGTDGTNFLVVSHSCALVGGASSLQWTAQLVTLDGQILASVNLTSAVPPPPTLVGPVHAVVGFDGTNYLVVYESDEWPSNLYSLVISPQATLLTTPTLIGRPMTSFSTGEGEPEALAFDGTHYLLTYDDGESVQRQLSAVFLSPSTGQAVGSVFPVSSAVWDSAMPVVGFDGTNYLAVWIGGGSLPQGLYAERITPAGNLLDAAPLQLVNCTPSVDPCDLEPTVAFDGTNYLVAYRDPRNEANGDTVNGNATISAARVSPAGMLLDGSSMTPGIAVTSTRGIATGRVRSVFINGSYLLVWEAGSPQGLWATRVTPAGTVPAAWTDGFSAVAAENVTGLPAMAANGGGALLVWLHEPALNSGSTLTSLRVLSIYPSGP